MIWFHHLTSLHPSYSPHFSTRAGCLPGLLRPAAAAGLGSAAPALPGAAPRHLRRLAAAGDAAGAGPGATHAVRWAREDLQDGKLGASEDFGAAFGDCNSLPKID